MKLQSIIFLFLTGLVIWVLSLPCYAQDNNDSSDEEVIIEDDSESMSDEGQIDTEADTENEIDADMDSETSESYGETESKPNSDSEADVENNDGDADTQSEGDMSEDMQEEMTEEMLEEMPMETDSSSSQHGDGSATDEAIDESLTIEDTSDNARGSDNKVTNQSGTAHASTANKDLQSALNRHGASLVVDGIIGSKTRKAIQDFQRKNKLAVSGMADPQTKAKLGLQ